jgi:hypothetical protein
MPAPGPHESKIGGAIGRLLHLEDPLRTAAYQAALSSPSTAGFDESTCRLLAGLHFSLMSSVEEARTLEGSLRVLLQHPALVQELGELLPLLDEIAEHVTCPLDDEVGWAHRVPLSVHARHTLGAQLGPPRPKASPRRSRACRPIPGASGSPSSRRSTP